MTAEPGFFTRERKMNRDIVLGIIVLAGFGIGLVYSEMPYVPPSPVASNQSVLVAQASGTSQESTGQKCETTYQTCIQTYPQGQAQCEEQWKSCMRTSCKLSEEEIAESTVQKCPSDPICQAACQQAVSGAGQATVNCCSGGPQRNLSCKKLWVEENKCLDGASIDGTPTRTPGSMSGTQTKSLAELQNDLNAARTEAENVKEVRDALDGRYQICLVDGGTDCGGLKTLSDDWQKKYQNSVAEEAKIVASINSYAQPVNPGEITLGTNPQTGNPFAQIPSGQEAAYLTSPTQTGAGKYMNNRGASGPYDPQAPSTFPSGSGSTGSNLPIVDDWRGFGNDALASGRTSPLPTSDWNPGGGPVPYLSGDSSNKEFLGQNNSVLGYGPMTPWQSSVVGGVSNPTGAPIDQAYANWFSGTVLMEANNLEPGSSAFPNTTSARLQVVCLH